MVNRGGHEASATPTNAQKPPHSIAPEVDEKASPKAASPLKQPKEKPAAMTASSSAVASQKTSKADLLKQVRKQKELHRREIRHLESELSRLKHRDPLRSCEILEEDISYLPQG